MRPEGRPGSPEGEPGRPRLLVLGIFDLLHPGVLEFLEAVSLQGSLTVGVLPDKRPGASPLEAPLYPQVERVEMVAALGRVDRVAACPGWSVAANGPLLFESGGLAYVCGGWVEREIVTPLASNPSFSGLLLPFPRNPQWSRQALLHRLRAQGTASKEKGAPA